MPDHEIRLRGGWERRDPADPDAPPARLSLPLSWPAEDAGRRLVLVRRFGRPEADLVDLVVADSPGVRAFRLDGRDLEPRPDGPGRWVVERLPLGPRNELELDVDVPAAEAEAPPWGRIALVVRESGPDGPS